MTARLYDLARLKRAVSVGAVLAHYGLNERLRPRARELVGRCPLPDHAGDRDNRDAFHLHPGRGLWRCTTHCGGGDLVALVAHLEGGSHAAAARALARIEQRPGPLPPPWHPDDRAPPTDPFRPYTKTLRLDAAHAFLPSSAAEQALESAGFRGSTSVVGVWKTRRRTSEALEIDVQVDLLVPATASPGSGRRAARLPGHRVNAARKVDGLEGALVDLAEHDIPSREPDVGGRVIRAKVAGPGALLVAKMFKIHERRGSARANDKDALDVLRIRHRLPARGERCAA